VEKTDSACLRSSHKVIEVSFCRSASPQRVPSLRSAKASRMVTCCAQTPPILTSHRCIALQVAWIRKCMGTALFVSMTVSVPAS
jgi:hypothetical protein